MGFFKWHDYDIMIGIVVIGLIGLIIGYFIVCDIIYVCFCYEDKNKKKNDEKTYFN